MSLSRVIVHKMKRKIVNFEEKVLLDNYWLPLAKQEDHWDSLLRHSTPLEESGVLWKHAVKEAQHLNRTTYDSMMAKEHAAMRKMQEIVDQEKILAAQEREDRLKRTGKQRRSS